MKDLIIKDKNYRESSNYDQSFNVELPKGDYKDKLFFKMDFTSGLDSAITAGIAMMVHGTMDTIHSQFE
jgi:hypothetical protein